MENETGAASMEEATVAANGAAMNQEIIRNNSNSMEMNINEQQQRMEEISRAFVEHYYAMFDGNRSAIPALYESSAMLSFEGHKMQGVHHISAKLASLPFDHCKHFISTVDCQPSSVSGGILVFVSGNIQLPGEQNLLRFSQMFHLVPSPEDLFFVRNDIFRLNYC